VPTVLPVVASNVTLAVAEEWETVMKASGSWASVDDVAGPSRYRRDTVYRWIEKTGLPAQGIGRLWKFKLSDVDDWVRRGQSGEVMDDRRA